MFCGQVPVRGGVSLVIVALLAFSVAAGVVVSVSLPADRTLFSVPLRGSASHLLAEIEDRYGARVQEAWVDTLTPSNRLAEADVLADGSPIIRVVRSFSKQTPASLEETLVHELFHLRLIADGFPALDLSIDYGSVVPDAHMRRVNEQVTRTIQVSLWDPILHFIFYPEMRGMGFDPSFVNTEEFLTRRRKNDLSGLETHTDQLQYYYNAALEFGDRAEAALLSQWYKERGWAASAEEGAAIARLVTSAHPTSPHDAVEVLARVVERVNTGKVNCDPARWQQVRRGRMPIQVAHITMRIRP